MEGAYFQFFMSGYGYDKVTVDKDEGSEHTIVREWEVSSFFLMNTSTFGVF